LATAAWIAAATISTGGMTALVIKKVAIGNAAQNIPAAPTKEDHHG
jgi:hypothetical protein